MGSSSLFELVSLNRSLRFVDDTSGEECSLQQLDLLTFDEGSKELIFLYIDNTIQSISIFWSVMRSKHCIALLPPNLTTHFKESLEALYKPAWIFDKTRETLNEYKSEGQGQHSFFTRTERSNFIIAPGIKILLNTSGTTGSPKFVKLSEQNLVANARSICSYLPINKNDVTPLNLPVYYSYGLSVLTSNAIQGGKIICTNDDLLKKDFWEKMARFGYTSIAGVPFVYEMLDRIGFTKKQYPSLQYFTQAGGKLQDALVTKFATYAEANNIKFFVMYGQTEATARMSYLPPENLLSKTGSIGKPIKDGLFSIDDQTNELCYTGPNVFGGYVNTPADLSAYKQESLLHTGDIARVDEDGFYYITGRLKRFVKLFGSRINLDEVETILSGEINVIAKCAGINDKQLVIFVPDSEADLKAIATFISTELKLHPSVIKVQHIEMIPLTANGKVNYTQLISDYATN